MRQAGRSLTDPPGLHPSNLAYTRTPFGKPPPSLSISKSGVLPMRSRIDSTLPGASAFAGTRRKLGEVRAIFATHLARLATAGDGGHDRNIVAFLQRGVEILQEANIVAVHINVDEAAHLA